MYQNLIGLYSCIQRQFFFLVFIWLGFLSRIYWSSLDHDLMASIWEKSISILAGNLNPGRNYLITAVLQKKSGLPQPIFGSKTTTVAATSPACRGCILLCNIQARKWSWQSCLSWRPWLYDNISSLPIYSIQRIWQKVLLPELIWLFKHQFRISFKFGNSPVGKCQVLVDKECFLKSADSNSRNSKTFCL